MRRPIPNDIKNAPKLKPHLTFFIEAFFDLVGDRNNGLSQGVIPWSTKKMYADHYKLDWETAEKLFYFLSRMDRATIESDDD